MTKKSSFHWTGLILGGWLFFSAGSLRAGEALFIGNSYTYGGSEAPVKKHGGVPKMVEAIATAKGKILSTTMVTAGGKDWGFHLGKPATYEALAAKKWDWIVLQDFSTEATHVGDVKGFMTNGEVFYRKAREAAPETRIVLYETWARAAGNSLYTGTSSAKSFADPAEMGTEIVKNYGELSRRLEELDPGEQVLLAPVGEAFARCLEKYPDIPLYAADKHHASAQGSYLAALVIYATLFQDSPVGATREFPGITFEAEQAARLQEVAAMFFAGKAATAEATRIEQVIEAGKK